jgi:hypothetical protein
MTKKCELHLDILDRCNFKNTTPNPSSLWRGKLTPKNQNFRNIQTPLLFKEGIKGWFIKHNKKIF